MTKDEFLSMLSDELEILEQEYRAADQRADYFREINLMGKEFQEANYQRQIVGNKVNSLRRLVNLPAYVRIQAMSDAEIAEYKKGKVEELELKVKEIESREKQERAKLYQLKAEREKLISQFGTLSGSERDSAVYRGQQLSTEIDRYETNSQWGVFAKLKKEIEEVRKQQEQIKTKTSQEIKEELCSEIKESRDFAQSIEYFQNPLDASTELQASVASDPEKAQLMANLLTYYRGLSDDQSQIKDSIDLDLYLPRELRRRLTQYMSYNSGYVGVKGTDKLIEIVEEFEGSFEQAKASFMEQFTEQKLSKLVGIEYGMNNSEVDMDFLQQHADKLGDGELENLQILVERRNKLSKKIFKTRNIKREIGDLNNKISQEQSRICQDIIGWYQIQSQDFLVSTWYGVDFYSLESLKRSLEKRREDISRSQETINGLKKQIQQVKEKMEQRRQDYETKKEAVAQQIRDLGGKKYEDTRIPYASEQSNWNLENIANSLNVVYQREVMNRVQQEAQNQADIREAELRGITVEQLLQTRQQAMLEESTTETIEEEVSHGMKR